VEERKEERRSDGRRAGSSPRDLAAYASLSPMLTCTQRGEKRGVEEGTRTRSRRRRRRGRADLLITGVS
jgi:hypothetical protein